MQNGYQVIPNGISNREPRAGYYCCQHLRRKNLARTDAAS